MLIKKELETIEPIPPKFKGRKPEKDFYISAKKVRLPKSGTVLAVFVYRISDGGHVLSFFGNKKNWIIKHEDNWSRCQIDDELRYYSNNILYYKNSDEIIEKYYNDYSYRRGICVIADFIRGQNYEKRVKSYNNKQEKIQKCIDSIPINVKRIECFCEKNILSPHIFISKSVHGKRTAICGNCGNEYEVSGVRHNQEGRCPKCRRAGRYHLETYSVPEEKFKIITAGKTKDGYTAYAWLNIKRTYRDKKPHYEFYLYYAAFEAPGLESRYYRWSHQTHDWKSSWHAKMYEKTYVYTPNLEKVLGDKYKNIVSELKDIKRPIYFYDMLRNYKEYRITEYLIKAGLYSLACNTYAIAYIMQNKKGTGFSKVLGINGQYAPLYREFDINLNEHRFIEKCSSFMNEEYIKKIQHLLKHTSYTDLREYIDILGIGEKKAITYAYNQCRKLNADFSKVKMWHKDYIGMSRNLNIDLDSKGLLLPPDIMSAHNTIMERIKVIEDRREIHRFRVACNEHYKTFRPFRDDKYVIVRPQSRADFIREGQILCHCVGKFSHYYENHVAGKAMILFIRSVTNTDKPLYTLELDCETLKIKQLYGKNDKTAPADVKKFVEKYIKKIEDKGRNEKCQKTA